jgi:hypothetical protein
VLELLSALTVLGLLTLALKVLFRRVSRTFPRFAERVASTYSCVARATDKAMGWLTGT